VLSEIFGPKRDEAIGVKVKVTVKFTLEQAMKT
jgi:hypothetical protein